MIQIYFAAGAPGTNLKLKSFANRAKRIFNNRRKLQKLSPAELRELREKTIRETPAEEVAKRMEAIRPNLIFSKEFQNG